MSDRNTFTVRIKPDLMKAIKILSVAKDTTMSNLVEEAIEDYLSKNDISPKKTTKK